MAQADIYRVIVGPHGLYACTAVVLGLFAGFLYVFNFTTFF